MFAKGFTAASPSSKNIITINNTSGVLYNVTLEDAGKLIRTTSGSVGLQLPSCAYVGAGFNFIYQNSSTLPISLAIAGADTITGFTSYSVGPGKTISLVVLVDSRLGKWCVYSSSEEGGTRAISLGQNATATGDKAIAIGDNAVANQTLGMAIGYNTLAETSVLATAIGTNSSSQGSRSAGNAAMALGGSYASGTNSFAAAVANNTSTYGAQGANAIVMGPNNKVTSGNGTVVGGSDSLAQSNLYAGVFNANTGTASGGYSTVINGYGASATQNGQIAYGTGYNGGGWGTQASQMTLFAITTGTAVVLTSDTSAAGTANQFAVATNQVKAFTGTLIGKQTGSANIAAYTITGTVVNNANTVTMPTGTLTAIGTPAAGWTAPTLAADNTNKGITITSGFNAATNIRWVCTLESSDLTYA